MFEPGNNGGLCILFDSTGSMSNPIDSVKRNIAQYTKAAFGSGLQRCTLITFKGHCKPHVLVKAGSIEAVESSLSRVMASGGVGNESMACSVLEAREIDPEGTIWLISDVIPSGVDTNYTSFVHPRRCEPCGAPNDYSGVHMVHIAHRADQEDLFRYVFTHPSLHFASYAALDSIGLDQQLKEVGN